MTISSKNVSEYEIFAIADSNDEIFANAVSKIIRSDPDWFWSHLDEKEQRKFLETCKDFLFMFNEEEDIPYY